MKQAGYKRGVKDDFISDRKFKSTYIKPLMAMYENTEFSFLLCD